MEVEGAVGSSTGASKELRLAELLASLSLATDLANGFAPESAMRSCLVATQIGIELGVEGDDLSDVYYLPLLRYLGCTAFAYEEALTFGGNDVAFRYAFAGVDFQQPGEVAGAVFGRLGKDAGPANRGRAIGAFLSQGKSFGPRMISANCEVSSRLAARLGMSRGVSDSLGSVFERWDGLGIPGKRSAESIPLAARVTALAHTVVTHLQRNPRAAVVKMVKKRSGTDFDPAVAEAFLSRAAELLDSIGGDSVWDRALAAEPSARPWLPASRLDDVCDAFADFADLKSPYTLGHSKAVARLAGQSAAALGLEHEAAHLRRSALVHHVGRVSVPNGIWDKPGRLTAGEWERVRLYPYYVERITAHSPAMRQFGLTAGAVQERLDGSGYHRGVPASVLRTGARLLAAADVYQAMSEERPHRPALPPEVASDELSAEAASGRLDREAVAVVLEAAGHERKKSRPNWPAGMTDREVEVLRLAAKAKPNKAIAGELFISEETVKNHIKHIYEKIGVATRSGAALFAMENDLIRR